jgi:hypothetical protein
MARQDFFPCLFSDGKRTAKPEGDENREATIRHENPTTREVLTVVKFQQAGDLPANCNGLLREGPKLKRLPASE